MSCVPGKAARIKWDAKTLYRARNTDKLAYCMEHSLSENVFECKYTPYREIRPNNFAFAQGAQARHPSARKSGRNSLDELPINSRNIVCIRKFEQQPSFAYLCALVLSAQFYAELLPSLRYSTFPCECFRLTCPVYALRARIRTKH